MPCTIRPLRGQDEADWRRHWTGYLQFYQTTVPEESTLARLVGTVQRDRGFWLPGRSGRMGLSPGRTGL